MLQYFMRDWTTLISINSPKVSPISCHWELPLNGVQLNFDGASNGNPGLGGFGGVIRVLGDLWTDCQL